jgi:hypothetical protein
MNGYESRLARIVDCVASKIYGLFAIRYGVVDLRRVSANSSAIVGAAVLTAGSTGVFEDFGRRFTGESCLALIIDRLA